MTDQATIEVAMERQMYADGVDYLPYPAMQQWQAQHHQRHLDQANNWGNYQPQNDPIARIEAKLDRILAIIGELQTQISSR